MLFYNNEIVGFVSSNSTEGIEFKDYIEEISFGLFKIKRVFNFKSNSAIDSGRLTFDFIYSGKSTYSMIPAVSYNGNYWGKGNEPKGFCKEGNWYSFAFNRVAVPGATYSENTKYSIALWGHYDEWSEPFSCSLMPENIATTHRLIWPQEEMPFTYTGRDYYSPGYQSKMTLQPGENYTVCAYLAVDHLKPDHQGQRKFLKAAWEMNKKEVLKTESSENIWRLGIQYALESLWSEEESFKGFSIGLIWSENQWIQEKVWKYEIGWCGQNASFANSLLTDYLRYGNNESLEKGLLCLDTWARDCSLPNGLFRTHYDYVLGIRNDEEILDACNLGTAALNYFEAFELARKCKNERPGYLSVAFGICDFMANDQENSGRFGKGWDTKGKCIYRDGTIGAFIIPPMIRAYEISGDEKYLLSAIRAFNFYTGELKANGYSTAGAIDTWCIDKESSMPLLKSALMLFEVTSKEKLLEDAEVISWYLSTWLWHYTAYYPAETDFSEYGFDTYGATSVSTQHHHLDYYALSWVNDWLNLAKYTQNEIWKEKALAIWYNGCQLLSDGNLEIHGKIRPVGSQNEGYNQCQWGGHSTSGGALNDWLVAWPGAFRLETLRKIEDWDILNSNELNK
ncbi:MAG: hypothetical protein AMS26_06940 [Bacteroides sp. SM23_62]|nr:MAG: hypothetical protein AMS26_06940 [Bacteroides sp. SM23_62]